MAYLLGYMFADGSLENAKNNRGKYVRVSSTDLITIQRIKKWLKSEHSIVAETKKYGAQKTRYLLRIGDQSLYEGIRKRGVTERKSLSMRVPAVPKKYVADFVRGYFDGDGCVHLYTDTNAKGEVVIRRLATIFTSGSRNFLEDLLRILKPHTDLTQTKVYKSHRSFQLRLSTRDSLRLFDLLYKKCPKDLYLERKFVIFQNYLRIKARPLGQRKQGRVAKWQRDGLQNHYAWVRFPSRPPK